MIGALHTGSVFAVQTGFHRQEAGNASDDSEVRGAEALKNLQEGAEGSNPNELSEEEQKVVEDLKQTDSEVRAHEQAHKTVGGAYAGSIQYDTVTGPDGREYAVGGEVPIDSSPIPGNPAATIRKLDIVIRAALAPAQPSSQDYAVARAAQQQRLQAQRELREQQEAERAEVQGDSPETASGLQAFLERENVLREEADAGETASSADISQAIQALQQAASLV